MLISNRNYGYLLDSTQVFEYPLLIPNNKDVQHYSSLAFLRQCRLDTNIKYFHMRPNAIQTVLRTSVKL